MGEQPPLVLDIHYQFRDGEVRVIVEKFEVMRVYFDSGHFANALFEKLKLSNTFLFISEEQRKRIYEEAHRKTLDERGTEITEEQFREIEGAAIRELELKFINESIEVAVKRVSDHLPNVVSMVWEKTIQAAAFSGANELRDILEMPEQKYSAKEIKEGIFQSDWERLKPLIGVTHGGARQRKSQFTWDSEKALIFYQTVEALPQHGADKLPMWEYARGVLRDNDYDHETIQFLMKRPMFGDVPEGLLKEAANVWRQYDENWDSLPPESGAQAFAFRHACHKLNFPYTTYNTVRTNYYKGKKASESKS